MGEERLGECGVGCEDGGGGGRVTGGRVVVWEERWDDGRLRAGVPPVDPPEADWCPAESDTIQVRPGADKGALK